MLTNALERFSQRRPNPRLSITGGPPEPSQRDPVNSGEGREIAQVSGKLTLPCGLTDSALIAQKYNL